MAARLSRDYIAESADLAKRADRLREEMSRLAQADAEAYGKVIEAQRAGDNVEEALSAAADIPLAIAEAGVKVADIATRLAEDGNPNLRGDAITALLLAEAGARAAARLAEINLSAARINETDDRLVRARVLADNATEIGA